MFHITIQNQCTPLYIAAQKGHSSVVEMLIKCGADVNTVEMVSKNVTTLHHI